jgi:iron complex transport system ATP-binding protein
MTRRAGAPWTTLSQGERGRTLIARALMPQPRLLLLDEPATGPDLTAREQLLTSLDELRRLHPSLASVLVTHHLEELPATTSHVLLLRDGRCVASGPAAEPPDRIVPPPGPIRPSVTGFPAAMIDA